MVVGNTERKNFIVDSVSGTTSHIYSQRNWFSSMKTSSGKVQTAYAKTKMLEVKGIGTVKGKLPIREEISLRDVLYVPDISEELISVKKIESAGFTIIFEDERVKIKRGNLNIFIARRNNRGQYESDFQAVCDLGTVVQEDEGMLWYRRLGHPSNQIMKKWDYRFQG